MKHPLWQEPPFLAPGGGRVNRDCVDGGPPPTGCAPQACRVSEGVAQADRPWT